MTGTALNAYSSASSNSDRMCESTNTTEKHRAERNEDRGQADHLQPRPTVPKMFHVKEFFYAGTVRVVNPQYWSRCS